MALATACLHQETLQALNTDLETIRQLITCKICQHFLYEPYVLSCGHTFCYSCLMQWLEQSRKKPCPDCRESIEVKPSPSYLIRGLVCIFISRSQLLRAGESIDEHQKLAQDEAAIVAKDKANTNARAGGLFSSIFNPIGITGLVAIHDDGSDSASSDLSYNAWDPDNMPGIFDSDNSEETNSLDGFIVPDDESIPMIGDDGDDEHDHEHEEDLNREESLRTAVRAHRTARRVVVDDDEEAEEVRFS